MLYRVGLLRACRASGAVPGRMDEVRERADDWREVCGRVRDGCGLAVAGEDRLRLRRSALPLFNRMCGGPLRSGGEEASMVQEE